MRLQVEAQSELGSLLVKLLLHHEKRFEDELSYIFVITVQTFLITLIASQLIKSKVLASLRGIRFVILGNHFKFLNSYEFI